VAIARRKELAKGEADPGGFCYGVLSARLQRFDRRLEFDLGRAASHMGPPDLNGQQIPFSRKRTEFFSNLLIKAS